MQENQQERQIYLRAKNPNPLFHGWLEQWLAEAQRKDSRKRFALAKALESLKKYPLVLHSGRDCSILEGFGNGICSMLDEQLKVYKCENPRRLFLNAKELEMRERTLIEDVQYLLEDNERKDAELDEQSEEQRQPVANVDKQSTKRRDAEDDMEVLFMKYGSIVEPDRFHSMQQSKQNAFDAPLPVETKRARIAEDCSRIRVKRNTFKIVLLVDTAETAGKSKRALDATIQGLNEKHVDYEVRRLSVGDFLWICKDTSDADHELVLPYVVERKRMDDLASSIKDGRFHEQKFRLNDSGIANIVYLIESRGSNSHLGLPIQNLLQAATNTQIHNQFSIKFTESHKDSMVYLSVMSKLLIKMFQDKDLIVEDRTIIGQLPKEYYSHVSKATEVQLMSFKDFAEGTIKMKNFTIRDLFLRQLIQLKGLSIDKAMAIVEKYPTPQHLIREYKQCRDKYEAENLLSNVQFGKMRKPIGSMLSKTIYNLYNL